MKRSFALFADVEHRKSFAEMTEAQVHPASSVSAPEGFLTQAMDNNGSAARHDSATGNWIGVLNEFCLIKRRARASANRRSRTAPDVVVPRPAHASREEARPRARGVARHASEDRRSGQRLLGGTSPFALKFTSRSVNSRFVSSCSTTILPKTFKRGNIAAWKCF